MDQKFLKCASLYTCVVRSTLKESPIQRSQFGKGCIVHLLHGEPNARWVYIKAFEEI